VGIITKATIQSENGSTLHTIYGMGSNKLQGGFVTLFNGLVRGCSINQLKEYLDFIEETARSESSEIYCQAMVDLIVTSFQTRGIRVPGSKGERDLARYIWCYLYLKFPKTIIGLLSLIPEYGYWKDLNRLVEDIRNPLVLNTFEASAHDYMGLYHAIVELWCKQLTQDWKNYESSFIQSSSNEPRKISLASKWFPKEGRSFDRKYKIAKSVANQLYTEDFKKEFTIAMKKLRQMISKLNSAINTTETLMHQGKFHLIKFNLVAGKCLQLKRRSFLNLRGGSKSKSNEPRSNERDRVLCAQNLENHMEKTLLGNAKMQGKRLFPHELVEKIHSGGNRLSPLEMKLMEIQYKLILEEYQTIIEEKGIDLDGVLPVVDISGSMQGVYGKGKVQPIMVSVALGILFSQLAKGVFKNRFLAFSEKPTWFQFKEQWSLGERVKQAFCCGGHGLSTDYLACHDLILSLAEQFKLEPDDLPKVFLILSDMQFNQAVHTTGNNQYKVIGKYMIGTKSIRHTSTRYSSRSQIITDHRPHHEILLKAYHDHGIKVCGKPYILPRSIYWNLRGDTTGCAVQANTPNTQIASGFSPQMLIPLMSGEFEDKTVETIDSNGNKITVTEKATVNPWLTFLKTINDPAYDSIRNSVEEVGEGVFRNYTAQSREEVVDDFVKI
jgi:hypothetical protein